MNDKPKLSNKQKAGLLAPIGHRFLIPGSDKVDHDWLYEVVYQNVGNLTVTAKLLGARKKEQKNVNL